MDEIRKSTSTPDLYLAAAYIALGATYTGVDRSNPRQMIFRFTTTEPEDTGFLRLIPCDFDEIEQDWINGLLQVNAKRYKEAIQSLKSIVHSEG